MYRTRYISRWISMFLILNLLFSLLPDRLMDKAGAATGDLEVRFGAGTRIGNLTYDADNSFINFYKKQTPGFVQTETDGDSIIDWGAGTVLQRGDSGVGVTFEIKVANNPALKALAQSGHAEAFVGWDMLAYNEFGCFLGWCKTRVTGASIIIDGQELSGSSHGGNTYYRSMKKVIHPESVIKISVGLEGQGAGAHGIFVKFQDKTRPELDNYTFTGNGAQRDNTIINQRELYAKQNENITLAYNFSEPVKPTSLNTAFHEHFLKHPLFTNPDGTGLPAAGQEQYLQNQSYSTADFGRNYFDVPLRSSIVYKYTASKYHHSGNIPLKPKITGTSSGQLPLNQTLEEKLRGAVLADAAGNVATINFTKFITGSGTSNNYLKGKNVNPFDYENGGYRIIVDAVAPKYTKVGNGIQPDILTGVVLNKDDTIDFIVQLTEEAIVHTGWDPKETYLLFNNGMKAYYISGFNTTTLTFRTKIVDRDKWRETPLLKVIAMTHDQKLPGGSDKGVIQDYAGNLLIQPANAEGLIADENGEDASNVNSKIDWAGLSIDNTEPIISFRYENGGADNVTYQKNGKVTIDANDPSLIIPALDPSNDRGAERPSKGIYRPSNMTGSASPAVGLVYYYWSQSPDNPFDSKQADQYAWVKRYSLSGKQPREDLYPDEFADLNLRVVNNKTNMIAPPAEALTEAGSGIWYLHSWTADMSWDSARELKQYEKMQDYIYSESGAAKYKQWLAEAPGSEADKEFYAKNKALAAVGQYDDLTHWSLSDFKQDDSNWTYNVGIIKLDNKPPDITIDLNQAVSSANVKVPVMITDAHSGISVNAQNGMKKFSYQWVKENEKLQEIQWKTGEFAGDRVELSTRDDIYEDGKYWLYVRAVDQAGNEYIAKSATLITVDSTNRVIGRLSDANPDYEKSHDIIFRLSGLAPATVNNFAGDTTVTETAYGTTVTAATYETAVAYVGYVLGPDVNHPDRDEAYKALTAFQIDPDTGEQSYLIPADVTKNGMQYVHVKVKESDGRYHYFSKDYYFDNMPPEVSFSKSGVAYPLPSQEVTVTVAEPYSKKKVVKQYQWVKDGEAEPDESSALWGDLPVTGLVKITDDQLQPGDIVDYRLYVKAVDGAGNSVVTSTMGLFKVSKAGPGTPPAAADGELIYVYGDAEDGYTAIAKLNLDREDKAGYEYSVSTDRGISWVKWRPYTNFISMKVPSNRAEDLQIQVKYRSPGGAVGEPKTLGVGQANLSVEPVYALASVNTSRPVNPDTGVDIEVAAPLGIKVVPSAVNPSAPVRSGNKFNVKTNGYYSFDLTDTADASRKDTLYIAISNVDGIKPQGTIQYLTTAKTNGNVSVKLVDLTEPVKITNNNGQSVYTFKKNGTFTFEFMDEAGNVGAAVATVSNIDKEGPRVKVVRSYAYGENNSRTFETIRDGFGNVIYSSGVTLTVQKADDSAKDFIVLDGNPAITMQTNGIASFQVADLFGSTIVVKEEVTTILSAPPVPESVSYTFVDDTGNPLPDNKIITIDGQPYAKGLVKVTLSGQTSAPNMVFSGVSPIELNGAYTNRISDTDGKFVYSRIYSAEGSTLIAISDVLGNVNKVPVTIKGLDNKAPEIVLHKSAATVVQNKKDFDFRKDLGGYAVSDNISKQDDINVSISGLDLSKIGRQRVAYTATDQVGNVSTVHQEVTVVTEDGMAIYANGILISGSSEESALFDHNKLTFNVSKYNFMTVGGQEQINERGTYDVLYYRGLYREGQMKAIAQKVTYDQLVNDQYKITFDKVGWYTIIVRNQERERVFASFFIGNVE